MKVARTVWAEKLEITSKIYLSHPKWVGATQRKYPLGCVTFYEMKKGQLSLRLMAGFPGIMIPFRNQYNQIVGWQVRVDEVKNSVHVKSGPTGIQAELVQQPNVVKITKR